MADVTPVGTGACKNKFSYESLPENKSESLHNTLSIARECLKLNRRHGQRSVLAYPTHLSHVRTSHAHPRNSAIK
jgi:hypothetical protein